MLSGHFCHVSLHHIGGIPIMQRQYVMGMKRGTWARRFVSTFSLAVCPSEWWLLLIYGEADILLFKTCCGGTVISSAMRLIISEELLTRPPLEYMDRRRGRQLQLHWLYLNFYYYYHLWIGVDFFFYEICLMTRPVMVWHIFEFRYHDNLVLFKKHEELIPR